MTIRERMAACQLFTDGDAHYPEEAAVGQDRHHIPLVKLLVNTQQFRLEAEANVLTIGAVVRKAIVHLSGIYKNGISLGDMDLISVDIVIEMTLYGHQQFHILMPMAKGGHAG